MTLSRRPYPALRPVSARTRRGDVVEVRGWEASEFHNHAIPFVVLREARGGRQQSADSHLGQRQLAHLQRGQALARISQPRSQEQRARSEDSELPFAQAKSVAQCHRAQVGTRQAQGRRTRRTAGSLRARRQSLPGI
jgi:hypothetical protein